MSAEPDPDEATEPASEQLAEAGADLAGALAGGALGLVGGPLGAFGGAALSVAVQRAAKAVIGRLSDREQARAGAALVLIGENTESRHRRGERLREDGFFNPRGDLRPDAEELLEGVLRHAAATYQERKVPLLAQLYAAVAHDSSVSPGDALFLLRAASEMTFRQFVALTALTYGHDAYARVLDDASAKIDQDYSRSDPALLLELDDLGRRGFVGVLTPEGTVADPTTVWGGGALSRMNLRRIQPTPNGERLCRLTGAGEVVSGQDVQTWIAGLVGEAAPESNGRESTTQPANDVPR